MICSFPTKGLSTRQHKRASTYVKKCESSFPCQVIDHLSLRPDAPNFVPAATQYPLNAVSNHVVRGLNPGPRVFFPGNTMPVVSDGLPAYTGTFPRNNVETPPDQLLPCKGTAVPPQPHVPDTPIPTENTVKNSDPSSEEMTVSPSQVFEAVPQVVSPTY